MCLRDIQSTRESCKHDPQASNTMSISKLLNYIVALWEGIFVPKLSTPLHGNCRYPHNSVELPKRNTTSRCEGVASAFSINTPPPTNPPTAVSSPNKKHVLRNQFGWTCSSGLMYPGAFSYALGPICFEYDGTWTWVLGSVFMGSTLPFTAI